MVRLHAGLKAVQADLVEDAEDRVGIDGAERQVDDALAMRNQGIAVALVRTRRPVFHLARSMLMLGMPASWVIGMQAGLPGGVVMTGFWISPLLILTSALHLMHYWTPFKPIEKGGVVTAGNASQQNDAAAACLVVAEDKLEARREDIRHSIARVDQGDGVHAERALLPPR